MGHEEVFVLFSLISLFVFVYFLFLLFVRMSILTCMYECVPYGDQKRALKSLELELQMIVSHHVGAGNQTQYSAIAASVLHH